MSAVDADTVPTDPAQAELLREIVDLRAKLASLPIIEQAKGVLIARYQLGPDAAFALLCRWSSHTNAKILAISTLLVDAATRPGSGSESSGAAEPAVAPLEHCLTALCDGHLPDLPSPHRHRPAVPRSRDLSRPRGPSV